MVDPVSFSAAVGAEQARAASKLAEEARGLAMRAQGRELQDAQLERLAQKADKMVEEQEKLKKENLHLRKVLEKVVKGAQIASALGIRKAVEKHAADNAKLKLITALEAENPESKEFISQINEDEKTEIAEIMNSEEKKAPFVNQMRGELKTAFQD